MSMPTLDTLQQHYTVSGSKVDSEIYRYDLTKTDSFVGKFRRANFKANQQEVVIRKC